jgi:hypothetical protein
MLAGAFALVALSGLVGQSRPAAALLITANDEVQIESGDQGGMFDISFFASSQYIFDNFCFGDCGGLTLADFNGVTLNTTTWWSIDQINLVSGGDDTIVFTVDIVDNSTGFTGNNDRIHSWGFNSDPDVDGAVAGTSNDQDADDQSTIWAFDDSGSNLGGFNVENCLFTPNNCNGGGSGLLLTESDQIELSLTGDFFADDGTGALLLQPDFAIKYQTALGDQLGASAICNTQVQDDCIQESLEIPGTPDLKVPEPSSWAVLASGLAGLGLLGWRRTRRQRRTAA